ncbi:apolipoprotein L3-like isoform X1 [Cavia porcellus]|uniref:apolipoprotein L3-like isoform X1 n=1 Tax=Cavia porcellus TaxID=10141 RepID=UPI002FDF38A7
MAGLSSTEFKNFIENVHKCITDSMSTDDLQSLLTHDTTWNVFVKEAELSRDEAKELNDYLKKHTANNKIVDQKRLPEDIVGREKFLEIFPKVKAEIESCIQKLQELAKEIDETHKGCTISNVATSSVGAFSGVMSIAGLVLAPFTAGGSLLLSAAGAGIGALSAASGITTTIVEEINTYSVESKAKSILSISEDRVRELLRVVLKAKPEIFKNYFKLISNIKRMGRNIRALRRALTDPWLAQDAIHVITTGVLSAERAERLGKALKGTVLSLSKGARIVGTVINGFFLGLDVYDIVKDSKHLQEGAKAPLGDVLRQKVQELEEELESLYQIDRILSLTH